MPTLAAPPAMNHQFHRFASDGYVVMRNLLQPHEVAAADHALVKLMTTSTERPEHLVEPHLGQDPFWLGLCHHPRIIDAVRQILGPDLVLLMSHLIVKPPYDGKSVPWHQDEPTWPAVHGADIVTVWLAIDAADCTNGCMRVIPRSHDGHCALPMLREDCPTALFDFKVALTAENLAYQVAIELNPGDIEIHDGHILHGSEANTGPRRRAGYTMRFGCIHTTTIDINRHWAPIYVVAGNAPEGRGYRDVRSPVI